jgi:hypothetical protein
MPLDILDAAGDGEAWAVPLWHEYEKATFRHQAITWSPALRKLQREWLNADEKTDDELAAEDVGGDAVVDVAPSTLRRIAGIPGLRAQLLDAWEVHGFDGLADVAGRHGFMLLLRRAGAPPLLCSARKQPTNVGSSGDDP